MAPHAAAAREAGRGFAAAPARALPLPRLFDARRPELRTKDLRVVAQRVSSGAVAWEEAGEHHRATIGPGLVLLVGVAPDDDEATIRKLAARIIDLRVFADEAGRMNLSLADVKGEALIVSQFTLFADMSRGRRPSLLKAGDPVRAEHLYESFVRQFRDRGIETRTGSFGAHMQVGIENDGPVTLVLSTDDWPTRV